jgi:8-oxo-dGTP pyrophosphatase MutT (NUDIX family)
VEGPGDHGPRSAQPLTSACLITRPLPDLPTLTARLRARPSYAPAEEHAGAAVATVFRPGAGSPEVLLIERAEREGDPWSGHIAFPGGRRDPADPSVLATAVRETKEEVGLALPPSSLVIRCDDLFARTNGYQVAQLVFALDGDGGPLTPNEEVAAVLWTPLAVLVAPENAGTFQFDRDGVSMELPCVHLGPHVLWGMTYRMLQALLEAVVA